MNIYYPSTCLTGTTDKIRYTVKYAMVFIFKKFKIKLEESSTHNQVPGSLLEIVLEIDYRKVIRSKMTRNSNGF